MRARLTLQLLVALGSLGGSVRAAAAESSAVTLSMSGCGAISAAEVRRITSIELKLSVSVPQAASSQATAITIRCDSGTAELALADGVTAKSLQRSVDLRATAALARPRLLALSVAELISASWAELELVQAERASWKQAHKAQLLQVRAVVKARKRRALEGDAQLLGGVRAWSSSWVSYGMGLRLQLARPLNERWAVSLASGLAYERGSRGEAAGLVELTLLDAQLAALLEARFGKARFGAGPGVRSGLLRALGQPIDPTRVEGHSAQDGYFGPILQARGTWSPGSALLVSAGLEAGLAARAVQVRVLGEQSAGARDTWLALTLGVGMDL